MLRRSLTTTIAACLLALAPAIAQAPDSGAHTHVGPGGMQLRVLLDRTNLGSAEVELAEIVFPAGSDSGDHVHAVTEIFYVLDGELQHIVGERTETLGRGDVGFVRANERVRHTVAPGQPVRALVIWAPGGEAARITSRWK